MAGTLDLLPELAVRPRTKPAADVKPPDGTPAMAPRADARTAGLPPAANDLPGAARASDLMSAPGEMPDVVARAQMSIALQQSVGNAALASLLNPSVEPAPPKREPAAPPPLPPPPPPSPDSSAPVVTAPAPQRPLVGAFEPLKAGPTLLSAPPAPAPVPAPVQAAPPPVGAPAAPLSPIPAAESPAPVVEEIPAAAKVPAPAAEKKAAAGAAPSVETPTDAGAAPAKGAAASVAMGTAPTAAPMGAAAKKEAGAAAVKEREAEEGGPSRGGGAGRAVALKMPEPPADLTPATKARIHHVKASAGKAAAAHAKLPNDQQQVDQAHDAVAEPQPEANAHAAQGLVAALGKRPAPAVSIEILCFRIYWVIRSKRPPDEDDLVTADSEAIGKAAGDTLKGDVNAATTNVGQGYTPLGQTPTGTAKPQVHGLEAPGSPEAVPIGAQQARPDAIPAKNVSLDADASDSRTRINQAGMNTEPAKLVQEGPIAEARAAQGELEQTATEDPAKVLAEQQAALTKASADMAALQARALAGLTKSRESTITTTGTQQSNMVKTEGDTRTTVSNEAQKTFKAAQDYVNDQITNLPKTALAEWDAGVKAASTQFKQHLAKVERWIAERHSGLGGKLLGALDWATGLPGWVTDEYDAAEQKFGDDVCALARKVSAEVNLIIAACEKKIADATAEIDRKFAALPKDLQAWAETEKAKFHTQLDALAKKATDTRDTFTRELVKRASQSVQDVREQVSALREKAKGLIGRVADAIAAFIDDPIRAIINGLLSILSIPKAAFWAVVAKIEKVAGDIADDPEKFANNLMAAVGKGFSQFFDHITDHLLHGFVEWLTGGLAAAGVQLPEDLSLKSLITFFLQLMGITWPRIRKLLAKHIGEENVALLEKAYSIIANLIALGPTGIFEMIKERLDPKAILDQIIKAAVDYMIKAVVKAVTARILLLFNPVGAILQALEAIYRVLKWIFTNAARIFRLIETIVNGIADIIAGNIGAMANAVETALAGLIPPVIDFLADYLGFGDLPDKVRDTILSFQDWIEGILDQVIGWLVEKGKALLAAVGLGGKEEEKEKDKGGAKGQVGKRITWTTRGEQHALWIEVHGADAVVMTGSTPRAGAEQLDEFATMAKDLAEDKKATVLGDIATARQLLASLEADADKMAGDVAKPEQDPSAVQQEGQQVASEEDQYAAVLQRIWEALGLTTLAARFKREFDKMHPLAAEYCKSKLDSADDGVQKAQTWQPVRAWLVDNGLIFTQPLTRTTTFVATVTQPKAESAVDSAIEVVAKKNGFQAKDVAADKPAKIVERSRSDVNAGSPPFEQSKGILQEFGFDERISPVLTLKGAYVESAALANELGLGEIQLHHLITEKMVTALALYHPSFPGQQLRDTQKYQYNSSPGGHIGYERWHRAYDTYMVGFIASFPQGTLTQQRLILEVHNYYQTDHGENVTKRIPGVNLL